MTVCRFFQQGYCRYGSSCRFEHIYAQNYANTAGQQRNTGNTYKVVNQPQNNNVTIEQLINQVSSDTIAAINGHQWCLTCYGPFKLGKNFPGMTDISPEEIRWKLYESRATGAFPQTENEIAQHINIAMEKFKALSKPTGQLVTVIDSVYKNEMPKDPFSNTFNTNQSQNVFGSQVQNVFSNNVPQNNSAATNLFAEAAKNIFQAPAHNSNNVFGSSNVFGDSPQNNSFTTFRSDFNQQQIANGLVQQNSVFGNGPGQSNDNIFAQNQGAVSPAQLFGAAAGNILNQPVSLPNNVFHQPTNNVQENPFGNTKSNIFQQPQTDIFAISHNPNSNINPFETQTKIDMTSDIYSKLEDLTEEELAMYKSDCFLPGQIPEVPPPLELCD